MSLRSGLWKWITSLFDGSFRRAIPDTAVTPASEPQTAQSNAVQQTFCMRATVQSLRPNQSTPAGTAPALASQSASQPNFQLAARLESIARLNQPKRRGRHLPRRIGTATKPMPRAYVLKRPIRYRPGYAAQMQSAFASPGRRIRSHAPLADARDTLQYVAIERIELRHAA